MSIISPIIIATRGSALALAQANMILAQCREKFPKERFELEIIKTTGDKLQTASMARIDANLPRGLFTKELEVALLENRADLAVHSLKDLPTELPDGLMLGGVTKREDARDVIIYRDAEYLAKNKTATSDPRQRGFAAKFSLQDFPQGMIMATSSTRRKAEILAIRPDFKAMEIRGNVATRLEKLSNNPEMDITILAAAGLARLNFKISVEGRLQGEGVPEGLFATIIDPEQMMPCVGQAAIGIEIRESDDRIAAICEGLNDMPTLQCVTAERSFLRAMGGGCQSPVGAYAEIVNQQLRLRAISFLSENVQRAEATSDVSKPTTLGEAVASQLLRGS